MNALASPEVGKYLNEYFCCSFQKVATFKIVGKAKQGGNVATYFCAPDGRVLHCIAGPVDANTMLRESKWVVETTKKAIEESKGDGAKFKVAFRKAHADKLRAETGLVVEPMTFDYDPDNKKGALSYDDPTGRPLAPQLPPPPVDGVDVATVTVEVAVPVAPASSVTVSRTVWSPVVAKVCVAVGPVAVAPSPKSHA